MKLNKLPKITHKSKKRVGRGYGSGKAKTAGRGTKGQKARSKVKKGFEGGQVQLIKRLPYLRGKGRNQSQKEKALPVSVKELNRLPTNSKVTLELLKKHSIISADVRSVKILGSEKVTKKLSVTVPCSKQAKDGIHKAGGTVSST